MSPMMLSNVIDYTAPIEQISDKLSFGGMMLLLGMGTVFAVLLIILITLVAFKLFFHDIPSRKKQKIKVVEEVPIPEAPVYATADEEIVAVITAAIAMAESEDPNVNFRVVSFKRI